VSTLLEACAGSAAVSLAAYGATPPASYRGGKRRYARAILDLLGLSTIERVELVDPGLWGVAWQLFAHGHGPAAARFASSWRDEGKPLFQRLVAAPPPVLPAEWLAVFLALQSSSVLSKDVTIREGRWRTSGYASLSPSARKKGFRERLLPSRVAAKIRQVPPAFTSALSAYHTSALEHGGLATHVLIDPPYVGVGGYSNQMPRADVVELALRWREAGCVVGVCEHGAVAELVEEGFVAHTLQAGKAAFGPRTASRSTAETLTLWRPR